MKSNFWFRQFPLALVACAMIVTAAAWQTNPGTTTQTTRDTVPNKKVKDIDDALAELEKARGELERTLSEKNWEKEMKSFDAEKIKAQIEEAMKEVDVAKIQAEVKRAMAEADFEKIKKEMQESLKEVDSEKIREQMHRAMKEMDAVKIKADIEGSMAKVDVEKIRAEMERVREVDLKKMEEELKGIGPKIEQSMKEARESMERAKKELTEFKGFLEGLEKDGLIDKNQPYKIEFENGELFINGKKQPAEVLNKYQSFLKDRRDFTIKKDKDDFNINMND